MSSTSSLSAVERIAQMTEWDDYTVWEYSDADTSVEDKALAAAQRFLAAQSFLLSWQEGKVPVGWHRPRRLADFDGEFPQETVDAALERINELIAERNEATTRRIAAVTHRRKSLAKLKGGDDEFKCRVQNSEIKALKKEYHNFCENVAYNPL